tara:strand:+ start:292 stop:1896 length:1605 start_codon:yes stop_codon:yes gene_type:complete
MYLYICGKTFSDYYFKKNNNKESENAIFGTILISFIALIVNFFLPLNKIVTTFIFLTPFLIFIKKRISKKEFWFFIKTTVIVFFFIVYSDVNRPDAGLYHLPYIQILNENKIIIGLGNLHFRFGLVSIVQYLSAINYNYIFGVQGIIIPLASLVSFILIYFFDEVFYFLKNKNDFKINDIFCLFILVYICYKINRYSGFGNDAPAHLLFFYLISIYLKSKINFDILKKTSLIASYAFLNKITLGVCFIFPLVIFGKLSVEKYKIFFSFSSIFILLWLVKNILISGCFINSVEKTCINQFIWADKTETIKQNISAEVWAKDWPNRIDNTISQENYLKNFNWLSSWSRNHLTYILKILIPYIIFLLIIILLIKFNKKKSSKKKFLKDKKKYYLIIIVSTIGTIAFLLKFPLYRYGYSYVITLIIFLTSSLITKYDLVFVKRLFSYLIILSVTVLLGKQVQRIYNNYNIYNIWPNIYSFSPKITNLELNEKKIGLNYKIFISKKECMYSKAPCTNSFKTNISQKEKYGYDIIYIKKN